MYNAAFSLWGVLIRKWRNQQHYFRSCTCMQHYLMIIRINNLKQLYIRTNDYYFNDNEVNQLRIITPCAVQCMPCIPCKGRGDISKVRIHSHKIAFHSIPNQQTTAFHSLSWKHKFAWHAPITSAKLSEWMIISLCNSSFRQALAL